MDRLVLAVNGDGGNGKISARKFLNLFLLDGDSRIADIKAIIEGDELHVVIRGRAGKVKLDLLPEEEV